MMTGTSLELRRGRVVPASEELRRQLLALVLAAVLVWYTFVVPAHTSVGSYRGVTPDDEGLDGEVRSLGSAAWSKKDEVKPKNEAKPVDELDWPEFIYP
jgi:hypothetical protein